MPLTEKDFESALDNITKSVQKGDLIKHVEWMNECGTSGIWSLQ